MESKVDSSGSFSERLAKLESGDNGLLRDIVSSLSGRGLDPLVVLSEIKMNGAKGCNGSGRDSNSGSGSSSSSSSESADDDDDTDDSDEETEESSSNAESSPEESSEDETDDSDGEDESGRRDHQRVSLPHCDKQFFFKKNYM